MNTSPSLARFFLDRLRRLLLAAAGLVVFSLGGYMQLRTDIGLSPWQAFNEGLTLHFPISFGTASILVSVVVVVTDLLLRESIGLGTVLDALLVGWSIDFFLWLNPIPFLSDPLPASLLLLLSIAVMAVGQYIYMKAALSCGPRDALLVALGRRFPKTPIGAVNTGLLVIILVIAFFLGGSIGLGTVINMAFTGPIMQLVFHLFRFEPRDVVHEGLADTLSAFRAARRG